MRHAEIVRSIGTRRVVEASNKVQVKIDLNDDAVWGGMDMTSAMSNPNGGKVSVVIPTYNRLEMLEKALDSVFAQTYSSLEVIVVDDGSTDGTDAMMAQYSRPVTYIKMEHAGSPAKARNVAIGLATGEYIAFLDSDDIWLPEKLEVQIREFDRPDVALVCSNAFLRSGDVRRLYFTNGVSGELSVFELLMDNRVITSTAVVRRSEIERVGLFRESDPLLGIEEYELWLRIAKVAKLKYLDLPTVIYLDHPQSIGNYIRQYNYSRGLFLIGRLNKRAAKSRGEAIAMAFHRLRLTLSFLLHSVKTRRLSEFVATLRGADDAR